MKDKIILLECSVMRNHQLQIVGDEFVTFIGHDDEFYGNLLFDRSISRPMCTHMDNDIVSKRKSFFKTIILTLTLAFIATLTPTLIPTLTLIHAVKN